jgi:calcium-dependent protein kinase
VHKVTAKGTLTPFSGVLKVEGSVLWERLSPAVKDMIKSLMTPNPTRRLTAAEALQHPWSKGAAFTLSQSLG